mgnify:CR=1 FL=1
MFDLVLKSIVVRSQFEGFHSWPDCPYEEVAFLRNVHRHIFHVEIKIAVTHNERELEFFMVKKELNTLLAQDFEHKEFTLSCEAIAEIILDKLREKYPTLYSVSVFEDNENGAVYTTLLSEAGKK